MVPTAKKKMQSFIQKHETGPVVNPHGPSSPPRQPLTQAAAVSASSPLAGRQNFLAMKVPLPQPKHLPPRFGKAAQTAPGTPQTKEATIREIDPPQETTAGWESAPVALLQVRDERSEGGGLRERWEEQSNIQSMFSETEPSRPASAHPDIYDEDDTRSDIRDNRRPSRRRRNSHRNSESMGPIQFQNGRLHVAPRDFSTSMITHPPRSTVPQTHVYKEDPFGVSSEDASPRPPRPQGGLSFTRSSYPIRMNEEAKRHGPFERTSHHLAATRRVSPESYDSAVDAVQPQAYTKPPKEAGLGHKSPTGFQTVERPVMGLDADDDDVPSQEDEYEGPQQRTPQAARQRVGQQDNATVVFNPQKPIIPSRPQKTVALQEEALPSSPMPRFPVGQHSPSKKRRRSIDYDEAKLQQMSFEDLQKEPFDHDPTREVVQSPARPRADNLGDRLNFYSSKGENVQAQFFTQISVREWEDCGDWFLDRFGDIVSRMKETRQSKRKMVEQYETEMSTREEAVRRKKESIERKLSKLKQDGDAMMKGKELDG